MTAVTRPELFDTFRPYLRPPGYTGELIAKVDSLADRLGLPANDNAAPPPVAVPPSVELGPETPAIAMISAALIHVACRESTLEQLAAWVAPVKVACRRFGIDEIREVASFLAQAGHESSGFTRLEEDLSYRAERLCVVWPKRFPTIAFARQYERNPEKLGNFVYANRLGNGGPETGDGYRFRGAGIFQNTGRRNHQAVADAFGMHVDQVPAFLRTAEGAALAAGLFWHDNGLDRLAATPGVEDETQAINGGQNGVDDRRKRFNAVVDAMLRLERGGQI